MILSEEEIKEIEEFRDSNSHIRVGAVDIKKLCNIALMANKLAETLQFYANEDNYAPIGRFMIIACEQDQGKKAKAALDAYQVATWI